MRRDRFPRLALPPPAGSSRPGGRFLFRLSRRRLARLLIPLVVCLYAASARSAVAAGQATVLDVVDGDTLRVRSGGTTETVRLIGIDAPERGHPSRPKEFGADEAADALSSMCLGRTVRLEKGFEEDDRHGRRLRYVFSADGRRLHNLELVRNGFARVYRRFPFSRLDEFEEAEAGARRDGLGLWAGNGLDALRWTRSRGVEPVSVWTLGGGEYGIAQGGMGKAGLGPGSLQPEIAKLAGMRAALSDAEFAAEARKAGFGDVGEGKAPAGYTAAGREAGRALPAEDIVSWEKAHEQLGRTITVEGIVLRAKRSGRAVFLNFHDNWKRYLTVVLFPGKVAGLPPDPVSFYGGRKIRVRGEVRRYKDRPEIVVESAGDIRVVP